MLPSRLIPLYSLELLFWFYVVWSWIKWGKSGFDSTVATWRRISAIVGFALATFSTALDVFMTIHAVITGGFPFYHPVELFCIRAGTLTSLLALLTVIFGKGKLRVPSAISSSITLFLWFAAAMSQ